MRVAYLAIIITAISTSAFSETIPTTGLVGYWSGNGNASDSSVNGNNGSFPGSYSPGLFGQAFSITPTNYVSIPAIGAYNFTTAFSTGFWFFGNPTTFTTFLGQDVGGGGLNKWLIDYNGTGFDLLYFNTSNGYPFPILTANAGLTNQWHQFTLVDDHNSFTFFLDGSSIGTATTAYPFPQPNAPLTIGYAEPGYTDTGLMEDVVLYNRALSTTEVEGLASPTSLVASLPPGMWGGLALFGALGLVSLTRRGRLPCRGA